MRKKKLRPKILIRIALLTLLMALIYRYSIHRQDVLGLIKESEPAAVKVESLGGNYPSYELWDEKRNLLGYAVIADSSGYGGKLSVLTLIGETGQINGLNLLENHETPSYLKRVLNSGLLGRIAQQDIKSVLSDVDAVSGATVTSGAIISSVQKGGAQIGNRQLGLQIPEQQTINISWKDMATTGLLLLALIVSAFNARKFRPWLLALSVIVIGFLGNYSLAFGNFTGLLAEKLPALTERPIWYVLVPGILLITLAWGKNFYCTWLCPFGAVQEGAYHSLNLFNFSPSPAIKAKVSRWRWPMVWLAAMLALIFNNGQIANYEPFPVFFSANGNTAQVILTILVVAISIAQIRFWCYNFCPVGLILNFLARIKRRLKKKRPAPATSSACAACSSPGRAGKQERLSRQDKIFAGMAVVINLLILAALLQNILLTL